MTRFDRRSFLGAAAGGALIGGLGSQALASNSYFAPVVGEKDRKTKHLVVVAMAGGVRTRETVGSPENTPNLRMLADAGVVYTRARTSNLGHFGATMSIFSGISEPRGIRENTRGNDPTIFEYVRKDLGLPANDVWVATSGGAQQVNYSYGLHPDYGARYGANTLDGEGVFNREFRALLETWGKPKEMPTKERAMLTRLRGALEGRGAAKGTNSAESAAEIENYILQELNRGTSDLTGANSSDAKALRTARNVLGLFKPKLVAVVLQDADVAHGSYNGYVEVLRRNDALLGEIIKLVQADPSLRDSTSFLVCPEFGRDRDLNSRRGLDHGDGTEDLNYVACVASGPDFKKGAVVKDDVQVIDMCPTVCELLGAKARFSNGRRLPGLLA